MSDAEAHEIVGQRHLSSNITELGPDCQEEVVLLAEWARVIGVDFAFEESHVGISDFGQRNEEEDNNEAGDEASYTEIDPLYVRERLLVIDGRGKEDTGSQERCDERPRSLYTLGKVQTDF